jgi:polyisoprenoid-binding protein YceI
VTTQPSTDLRLSLPEGAWLVSPANSTVAFSVRNFWVSTVRGEMRDFEGVLTVDAVGSLSIRASASAASIDTGNRLRDHHLRSADFLDAERHPRVELRSHGVRRLGGGRLEVDAEVTLRGITRPVSLAVSILPPEPAEEDEPGIRIAARGRLDRRQFAIARGRLLDKIVGAEVDLDFEVRAPARAA